MDTCTNTVQRPDTSCTYCAALGGNVRTFSKRVGPRAKNSKYPMLTRDTCRSVDFTAWRVCPHTHTYIYIHTYTFARFRRTSGISSSYVLVVRVRVPGAARTHGGGREAVVAACYTRVCTSVRATWAAFGPACTYARLYMVTYGRVDDCVIALGGGKLREADRVETDDGWSVLLISR